MKFTFLLSSTVHVRFLKRVDLLNKLGIYKKVFAFARRDSYPGKKVNFEFEILDSISHQTYLKRLGLILKAVKKIKAECKDTDVIYTFGLDMLFLDWLSQLFNRNRKLKLVYEVGDIREILLGESLINKLARGFEKFLIKKINLLVVTSEAFYTEYFSKVQSVGDVKHFVIENKLDEDWLNDTKPKPSANTKISKIRIGYFGVLRCERSLEILKRVAQKNKNGIEIYLRGIAGVSTNDKLEELKLIPNIEYGGSYVAPDDLNELYNSVDIVWASYPYQGEKEGNWKWAKTIRFYESCYFRKPMIVQKGTEDYKSVSKYDIGYCLDLKNISAAVQSILELTNEELTNWSRNFEKLPEDVYLYNDEHKELIELLT